MHEATPYCFSASAPIIRDLDQDPVCNFEEDMSEPHTTQAHTGPIKNPKQLLNAVLLAFVVPIFTIIALVMFVSSADMPSAGSANPERAIALRIQKVGAVEIRDANRPLKSGEEVFKAQCSACHATGAAGSPKFSDAAAWAPRIKTGYEALLHSALAGKGAMSRRKGAATSVTWKLAAQWCTWPTLLERNLPNLRHPLLQHLPMHRRQRQPNQQPLRRLRLHRLRKLLPPPRKLPRLQPMHRWLLLQSAVRARHCTSRPAKFAMLRA